jgi:hypothetical protein
MQKYELELASSHIILKEKRMSFGDFSWLTKWDFKGSDILISLCTTRNSDWNNYRKYAFPCCSRISASLLRCCKSIAWTVRSFIFRDVVPRRIWGSHSGTYKEFYLMEYNAMQSSESQLMFQRNMSLPSAVSKNKQSKKSAWSTWQAELCWFFASLILGPQNGGDLFLWNVSWFSTGYMALYLRR